jgi:FkbM family methyltransferase
MTPARRTPSAIFYFHIWSIIVPLQAQLFELGMSMVRNNLIFDFGLHRGEDTDFYLRKGFHVVAFEANPALVQQCQTRFTKEIARGQLEIVDGAIAPPSFGSTVEFYENALSVWGTIDPKWAKRNEILGKVSKIVAVKRIDLLEVFMTRGTPFFVKIDLEGVDEYVLKVIKDLPEPPELVSVESEKVRWSDLTATMELLLSMGYRKFKVVQQATIPGSSGSFSSLDGARFTHVFPNDASGAFGEDIHQPWLSSEEALNEFGQIFRRYRWFGDSTAFAQLPSKVKHVVSRLTTGHKDALPGWYDLHASL